MQSTARWRIRQSSIFSHHKHIRWSNISILFTHQHTITHITTSSWRKLVNVSNIPVKPKPSAFPLWQIQDLDWVYKKKDMRADVRGLDLWTDTWPSAGRIIYSCWKMVDEYFIDSLSRVISHTSDRLPDTTLDIFYIAFDVWNSNMLHAESF